MNVILKMNRNRQVNLPSAFVARLNLGEGNYFMAEVKGNHIVLTPVDPIERVFSESDLDLVEETFQREKNLGKAATPEWIRKAHRAK